MNDIKETSGTESAESDRLELQDRHEIAVNEIRRSISHLRQWIKWFSQFKDCMCEGFIIDLEYIAQLLSLASDVTAPQETIEAYEKIIKDSQERLKSLKEEGAEEAEDEPQTFEEVNVKVAELAEKLIIEST